jgi:hypothetical protein
MQWISWLAENRLAYQEGLCCMELVTMWMEDLRFSHWCCWGCRFSGMCHQVIFWRVLVPWLSSSLRRVVVLLPGLGLLDLWRGWQFSPLQQELLSHLHSITFQQIWIILLMFKVCKSVHHCTIQINQPTGCNNFSSLLFDVYVQLNMFWASSRPSSGAQQLR